MELFPRVAAQPWADIYNPFGVMVLNPGVWTNLISNAQKNISKEEYLNYL